MAFLPVFPAGSIVSGWLKVREHRYPVTVEIFFPEKMKPLAKGTGTGPEGKQAVAGEEGRHLGSKKRQGLNMGQEQGTRPAREPEVQGERGEGA